MRQLTQRCFGALFSLGYALVVQAAPNEDNAIELLYIERPPFMKTEANGSVGGVVGEPVLRAFTKAGIPFKAIMASPARQLALLKANQGRVCIMGWYKNEERKKFGKYSEVISQDGPMVGLAKPSIEQESSGTVSQLLKNTNIGVLIKKTIYYGPYLDRQFAQMKADRIESNAEYADLIRLVKNGRAHILFMPQEEAHYYIENGGYAKTDFNVIQFADMPPGEKRHVICSIRVDDATIDKFNAALKR